jgi:hypothetical protein
MRCKGLPGGVGLPVLVFLALFAIACEEEQLRKERVSARVSEEVSVAPPVQVEAPAKEDTTARGRLKLYLPKPGQKGRPVFFSWYLYPGAESYQLFVLDPEEKVVYEGPRSTENLTALPDGWDEDLPGGVYFWQVLAFDAEGNEIGNSAYHDFLFIKE